MKKIISEEIKNMKYLLGYKRGVVITEQENTLTTSTAPVTPTSGTTQPVSTTNLDLIELPERTTEPIKIGVPHPRVQVLQKLLNDKFQSGLVADGKYGPKTANAIYKNIVSINKQQITSIQANLKPAGETAPAQINANAVNPK